MQPTVPDRDHQFVVSDGQGAGEVNGISATESMAARQFAGPMLDGSGQLDGQFLLG